MAGGGEYLTAVIRRLWAYAEANTLVRPDILDRVNPSDTRPPVVKPGTEISNILLPPDPPEALKISVLATLPTAERHRHFRSMRSSQALTVSVFAILAVLDRVEALAGLMTDDGLPAFFPEGRNPTISLEHTVGHLGEPRPTSIDVWLSGDYRTAIECKFTEVGFGNCSRPNLVAERDPTFARQHCDGTYTRQRGRSARCSLTEIGVRYWTHLPKIARWSAEDDLHPCPLRNTYQLMRNVLAATVLPDGTVDVQSSHALVLYDERNPAFREKGVGTGQWLAAKRGLKQPALLRRCSWQSLRRHLAQHSELNWLVTGLGQKYGF